MRGVALWFFASAVVYVSLGMIFGLWMSASGDHMLAPAHAHLNLVGWVTMALFGVYYHLVPSAQGRLANLHFALAILGKTELPVVIGSFCTLASMLLFLAIVLMNASARTANTMAGVAPAE